MKLVDETLKYLLVLFVGVILESDGAGFSMW